MPQHATRPNSQTVNGTLPIVHEVKFAWLAVNFRPSLAYAVNKAIVHLLQSITCCYDQPFSCIWPLSHCKVSFESHFRKSTFERKLSIVNGPLWKVYHFQKWLSQNRTCSILWKPLSKVVNCWQWTIHTGKPTFESRLSTVKGAYKFTTRVNMQLHALQCAAFRCERVLRTHSMSLATV